MAEAFQCDRCEDLHEGRPYQHIAWGPTPHSADERVEHRHHGIEGERVREFCESCWNDFMNFVDSGSTTEISPQFNER